MTAQEIFDKVWDWFIVKKNPKSVADELDRSSPTCLYRGPNGEKCALGVLIEDHEYTPDLEGFNAHGVIVEKGFERLVPFATLIAELQIAHDYSNLGPKFHACMETRLRDIATAFKLTVPAPSK